MRKMIAVALLAVGLVALSTSVLAGPGRFSVLGLQTQTPGSIVCPLGLTCIGGSSVSGKPYLIDTLGLGWPIEESQAAWRRSSAPSGPLNGAWYYDTVLGRFQFYNSGWFEPASKAYVDAIERPFTRTCTITSAAAATPVTCLSDADVPSTAKAYLLGWHAKVNGSTAWATTATCTIRDSASTGFAQIAVAALTGNAYVEPATANVTLLSAYSLNSGGMADLGLQLVCNANGTGSDLVVTLYGVVK